MGATSERSTGTIYQYAQADPEFAELRSRLRRFVFPMTGAFLLWYLSFVLLASYAPAFMATPVLGAINVGLIMGLLQFASTFAIATLYGRYASKRLDPAAGRLQDRIEGRR